MSSFERKHHIYLFSLRNGKLRLAYGSSPEEALETLGFRLDEAEMDEILPDRWRRIRQQDLRKYVDRLA